MKGTNSHHGYHLHRIVGEARARSALLSILRWSLSVEHHLEHTFVNDCHHWLGLESVGIHGIVSSERNAVVFLTVGVVEDGYALVHDTLAQFLSERFRVFLHRLLGIELPR